MHESLEPMGPASTARKRQRAAGPGPKTRGRLPLESADSYDSTGDSGALTARRALSTVVSRAEAARVLRSVVEDMGGYLIPARLAGPEAIAVDVSLGVGEPMLVMTLDTLDLTLLRLSRHLPVLVEDALSAAARCEADEHQRAGASIFPGHVTSTYDDYLYALATADPAAAVGVLEAALAVPGESTERLIRDVLVRAQRQVGHLWMHGRWSDADEHAATAVTEQALAAISPAQPTDADAPYVVFACAEGEWHTMPARLAGELARSSGVSIVQLGGSVPADHLSRHLSATLPEALALSVTMPTNLIGASRSIQAARSQGVRVVVGGAAWGKSQHRARRLGADQYLDNPTDLGRFLDDRAEPVHMAAPLAISAEALLLDSPAPELLIPALDRHRAANSWMHSISSWQQDQWRQDLGWLARHAAAAIACDDPTIVREFLNWLLARRVSRDIPAQVITDACYYLADAVAHDAPTAAQILHREVARAHAKLCASTAE